MKTTAFLSGVLFFFLAVGAAAESGCPAEGGVLGSELWQVFSRRIEEHYLLPNGLQATGLSPRQWAKILGHGLSAQARYVSDDAERRTLFACLEEGVAEALSALSDAHRDLPSHEPEGASATLSRVAHEATIGFYDDEVSKLTGVGPAGIIPSVFDETITVPASVDLAKGVEGHQAGMKSEPSPGRCRFNLHPSLYTSTHPTFVWYLIRQPMSRGGYYYDTVEVNPEWSADHPKRPENGLKPEQYIVAQGSKAETLERIRELRKSCI